MYDPILDALRRGAVADALAAAEALSAERPDDAQALRWLSAAQLQSGLPAAALATIDRAIALAPENADLHLARAGVLVGARRPDEAQEALTHATGLDPNQFTAYLIQAQLALGRGDLDEAERLRRLAARVVPDHPQLAAVEGMVTLRRGDADQALKIVSAALQEAPEDVQLRYALGFIHMALGHWAFAEQAFRGIVEKVPGTGSLRSLVADLIRRQGRPADAADELQPLVAADRPAPALHRYIGHLRLAAGQNDEALAALRVALAGQPRDRDTVLAIVEAWRRLGAQDDARATLDAALATTTDSHDLWLARLLFEPVGSAEARAVVERWTAAMPDHVPALEARMTVLDGAGEHETAETVARRIVELDPGRASGEQRLVEALLQRDPMAAIARVGELASKATDPGQQRSLRAWQGFVRDRAGRHADAVGTWSALAHELAPSRLPLWAPTGAQGPWPELAPAAESAQPRPILLWGAPGTVVESLAGVLGFVSDRLRGDRFLPEPPQDSLQSYYTPARLLSGELSGEALVADWRARLAERKVDSGVIDWLLWWDNALLHALRPHLPEALLLVAVRDPRDAFLDWLAFGSPAPLALDNLDEGAAWLAKLFAQVADLHEHDLYPSRLIRMDDIKDDAGAVSQAIGQALGVQLPVPPSSGARRFPAGHWRQYAQALAGPFAALTPVAVRLGYPEA